MSEFVNTPMSDVFVKKPEGYKGGSGVYNGDDCPPFDQYKRTPSPAGVPEKIIDGSVPKPTGEADHY